MKHRFWILLWEINYHDILISLNSRRQRIHIERKFFTSYVNQLSASEYPRILYLIVQKITFRSLFSVNFIDVISTEIFNAHCLLIQYANDLNRCWSMFYCILLIHILLYNTDPYPTVSYWSMSSCILLIHVLLYPTDPYPTVSYWSMSSCILLIHVLLYPTDPCPTVSYWSKSYRKLLIHVLLYPTYPCPSVYYWSMSVCILLIHVLLYPTDPSPTVSYWSKS